MLRLVLFVWAPILLGADKPRESAFEVTIRGDCLVAGGEGFTIEGRQMTYDPNEGLLTMEGDFAVLWSEGSDARQLVLGQKIIYNLRNNSFRAEGLALPGLTLTYPQHR